MSFDTFGWDRNQSGARLFIEYLQSSVQHDYRAKSVANGVVQGIRNVVDTSPLPRFVDDGARLLTDRVKERLAHSTEPTITFLNLMEAHEPMVDTLWYDREMYNVPIGWSSNQNGHQHDDSVDSEYLNRYREVYTAAIDYLDRKISEMAEELIRSRDATVVVTADHGENLWYESDDELFGHVGSLSEALLHVPLLIINPPKTSPTGTIDQYVSHVKLLSSLASGEWNEITEDVIAAECIGGSGWSDSADGDAAEWWNRTIRTAYYRKNRIEWDSTGDKYEIELTDDPSSRISKQRVKEVPSWAEQCFRVSIEEAKNTGLAKHRGDQISGKMKNRLEELGYR
jgi:hypothetical protein